MSLLGLSIGMGLLADNAVVVFESIQDRSPPDTAPIEERRAAAVVAALTTKHGIAVARLRPDGVGPLAPVASNKTEEGRAKNRRVELVEQ